MKEEIINRVAKSGLITIDLAEYIPKENIVECDIKDFLFKGIILKEKEFRSTLKDFDFSKYEGSIVALFCSSEAIIPMWSYMLVSSYLNSLNCTFYFGTKEAVFQKITLENINSINETIFIDKKVIIKGCSTIPLNASLYIAITKKIQNSVASLMFGEACSAVPVYKK